MARVFAYQNYKFESLTEIGTKLVKARRTDQNLQVDGIELTKPISEKKEKVIESFIRTTFW